MIEIFWIFCSMTMKKRFISNNYSYKIVDIYIYLSLNKSVLFVSLFLQYLNRRYYIFICIYILHIYTYI